MVKQTSKTRYIHSRLYKMSSIILEKKNLEKKKKNPLNHQTSTFRKNISAHCMHGYRIWAAVNSSWSLRPIIWQHLKLLAKYNQSKFTTTSIYHTRNIIRIDIGTSASLEVYSYEQYPLQEASTHGLLN